MDESGSDEALVNTDSNDYQNVELQEREDGRDTKSIERSSVGSDLHWPRSAFSQLPRSRRPTGGKKEVESAKAFV